jgi:hypothetical protein
MDNQELYLLKITRQLDKLKHERITKQLNDLKNEQMNKL